MTQEKDALLMRGFGYADLATSTDDPEILQDAMALALSVLKPLSSPEHRVPRAAYGVGMLAHFMATQTLRSHEIEEEERLVTAYQFFTKAAKYFAIAAAMEDFEKDGTPAQAADALAYLRERGVIEG